MGLDATIDLQNSDALLGLSDLKRKQLPFAQALALTRTAQAAQKSIKRGLPGRFTIRNKFIERGVRIERATKRRPEAVVHWRAPGGPSRRGFAKQLALQETGGTKRPKGRTLALARGIKRGKGGTIPKGQRPAAALKRKNVFIADARGGAAILKRTGRKGAPRLLYFLSDRPARIAPQWGFKATAEATARRVYRREFGKAFAQALRSGR